MPIVEPIAKILWTPFGVAECDARYWPDSPDLPCTFSCWMLETRENWVFPQQLVRACESMASPAHGCGSDIFMPDKLLESYLPHVLRHHGSPFYERAAAMKAAKESATQ